MVTAWNHQKARNWLASQLRAQPDCIVQKVEELLAQGAVVEVQEEPDWSEILPLLDADFRESFSATLSLPRLTNAESSALLQRWIEYRARLQAIFVDKDWWANLWSRLDELAEAGKEAASEGVTLERSEAIGSGYAAEDLRMRLTGVDSSLDLDSCLVFAFASPRMRDHLGPLLPSGIGETATLLEPLLSRCRRLAAMCWNCAPDVQHFEQLLGRAHRGFQAAVMAVQDASIDDLEARAGWLELLEVERFFVERDQVKALSAELNRQLGRTPTINELCAAHRDTKSEEPLRETWLEDLAGYQDLLQRRKHREANYRVLDHWELDPPLADAGLIAAPLTDTEDAATRVFRVPTHTIPEIRVLAWHIGFFDGTHRSLADIALQFGLPMEMVGRLERRGLRKSREKRR